MNLTKTTLVGLTVAGLTLTGTIHTPQTPTNTTKPVHILGQTDPWRWYQWSITAANINTSYKNPNTITIAIIDTGINPHEDLPDIDYTKGKNYINPEAAAKDDNGHGTHIAGIITAITANNKGISGAANNIKLLPIKVLDQYGNGDTADVSDAIRWAVEHDTQIINLSLGSDEPDENLQNAIDYAQNKNTIIIAAAGNNKNQKSWPGAYTQTLTVGACDENLQPAGWSANFDYVDVCAPGVNIISTTKTTSYTIMSGTSMATPYTTALAALLLGKGTNPDNIAQTIKNNTTPTNNTPAAGTGMINYRKTLNDNTDDEETPQPTPEVPTPGPTPPTLPDLPDLPKLPDNKKPTLPNIGHTPKITKLAVLKQTIKQKTYITALTQGTNLTWQWKQKPYKKPAKTISTQPRQITLKNKKQPKTYKITLTIKNNYGKDKKTIKINN